MAEIERVMKKETKISCTVGSARVYTVRRSRDNFGGWGIFTVHDHGLLQAHTDYGSYQYWWSPDKGSEMFEETLLRFGEGYLMDKFSYPDNGGRHFYQRETLAKIRKEMREIYHEHKKELIRKYRGSGAYAEALGWKNYEKLKDLYYEAVEAVEELEEYDDRGAFYMALHKGDVGAFFCEYGEPTYIPCEDGPSPQLKAMMKYLWPVFREAMQDELKKRSQKSGAELHEMG